MMTIYFDGSAVLEPGAAGTLAHLAEAGHDLILIAEPDHPAAELVPWARHLPSLPDEDAADQTWFITADPATCADHQSGIRTMLIGPREAGLRTTRCDATARDLRDAMLELLASDAMDGDRPA